MENRFGCLYIDKNENLTHVTCEPVWDPENGHTIKITIDSDINYKNLAKAEATSLMDLETVNSLIDFLANWKEQRLYNQNKKETTNGKEKI